MVTYVDVIICSILTLILLVDSVIRCKFREKISVLCLVPCVLSALIGYSAIGWFGYVLAVSSCLVFIDGMLPPSSVNVSDGDFLSRYSTISVIVGDGLTCFSIVVNFVASAMALNIVYSWVECIICPQ